MQGNYLLMARFLKGHQAQQSQINIRSLKVVRLVSKSCSVLVFINLCLSFMQGNYLLMARFHKGHQALQFQINIHRLKVAAFTRHWWNALRWIAVSSKVWTFTIIVYYWSFTDTIWWLKRKKIGIRIFPFWRRKGRRKWLLEFPIGQLQCRNRL